MIAHFWRSTREFLFADRRRMKIFRPHRYVNASYEWPILEQKIIGSWGLSTCVFASTARLPCWVGGFRAWQPSMLANTYVDSPQEHMQLMGKCCPIVFVQTKKLECLDKPSNMRYFFQWWLAFKNHTKNSTKKLIQTSWFHCLDKFCSLPVTQILNYWIHTLLTPSYIEAMMKNACHVCMCVYVYIIQTQLYPTFPIQTYIHTIHTVWVVSWVYNKLTTMDSMGLHV